MQCILTCTVTVAYSCHLEKVLHTQPDVSKTEHKKLYRELVAIDDAMGQGVMDGSLTAQGLVIPKATIRYLDNKSTILLAENGEVSSSRGT